MKRFHSIVLILLVLCLLCACSTAPKTADELVYAQAESSETAPNSIHAMDSGATPAQTPAPTQPNYDEKIIYSAYLDLETTEFDAAISALEASITKSQGFIADSNVSGATRYDSAGAVQVVNRSAHYEVRIPAALLDDFLAQTDGLGNVTSSGRSAENVTSQYTDSESRLSSLRTEQERLLALLEQADSVDALIAIESKLTEVRYNIESVERMLRDFDTRIQYSSVTISLREVGQYTKTAAATRSYGERLSDALLSGLRTFGRVCQEVFLFLVSALPVLVLIASATVVGVLIRRKKRQKASKKDDDSTE